MHGSRHFNDGGRDSSVWAPQQRYFLRLESINRTPIRAEIVNAL